MTHQVEKTLRVKLPKAKLWAVLEDYSAVENFAATVISSPIVGDKQTGLGAKRLCTFKDGSSLIEEIIDYKEGQGYRMELQEFSMPLNSMQSEIGVKEIDAETSELYMTTDFVVKGGPLGKLMGHLLMRPMMKGVFEKVLTGLAYYCETGQLIDDKMPSKEATQRLVVG